MSATLLALLAWQAQCRTRERHQPHLADRLPTALTDAVRTVLDPAESPLSLREHVPGVVRQAHLVVALERGRPDVCLVVAGTVARVTHQVVQLVLGEVQLRT